MALTIAGVAVAVHYIVPSMPWAAAIALGAIVAPPDASAATTVLRRLRPPHRLMVILEGESLFNDASALLAYRIAVGAAMTGAFSGWTLVPMLLLTCGGGAIFGIVLARAYLHLTQRIKDLQINIVLQFIGTFSVWILAERLGLSAIITTVAYAMTIARTAPARVGGRARISSYAVWEVAVFVMNVLAFVLIGLQMRAIVERIEDGEWGTFLTAAGAVCAAVILIRIAWVMPYNYVMRWKIRRFGTRSSRPMVMPTRWRRNSRRVVWNARHRHAGRSARLARWRRRRRNVPAPGSHRVLRVLRRARHAGRAGHDARATSALAGLAR